MHKIAEVDIRSFVVTSYLIFKRSRYICSGTIFTISTILGKPEGHSISDKESKKSQGDTEGAMEKGVNRKGGGTDPNFLSLVVPRLSVCADAQKVDRSKLAQTEARYLN